MLCMNTKAPPHASWIAFYLKPYEVLKESANACINLKLPMSVFTCFMNYMFKKDILVRVFKIVFNFKILNSTLLLAIGALKNI